MLKQYDQVFVFPNASLAFGGRWGRVSEINGDIVSVKFNNLKVPFGFKHNELLTKKDYALWFNKAKTIKHIKTGELFTNFLVDTSTASIALASNKAYPIHDFYPVTFCEQCGQETTGQFSALCEDCQYPIKDGTELDQ